MHINKLQTCRWPDCEKDAHSRGLCKTCYYRASQVKTFDDPWDAWESYLESRKPKPCRWPECSKTSRSRGFCTQHLQRAKVAENFDSPGETWGICVCEWCGQTFNTSANRVARACSPRCRATLNRQADPSVLASANNRRRARLMTAEYEHVDLDALKAEVHYCYLCGRHLDYSLEHGDPDAPQLEHVIPLSKGGAHRLSNVTYAHAWCNYSKGDRTPEEDYVRLLGLVSYMFYKQH